MKYKSLVVNEDGTRNTKRRSRKAERGKTFWHNNTLVRVARKERKLARREALEAEETGE